MSNVLVQLQTKDYAIWRPVFDELAGLRKSYGCLGGQLFRRTDQPNNVAVLYEWNSAENARRYFESPELREGMKRAGVQGPPEVVFLDTLEKLSA